MNAAGINAFTAALTFKPSQTFVLGIMIGCGIILSIMMINKYLSVITRLREIDSKREAFKNHFYQFLDLFPVGILGLNQAGEIVLRNYAVKLLTGIDTQGLKDLKDLHCFSETQIAWLRSQTQQSGPNRELPVQLKTASGIKNLLLCINVPAVRDPDLPAAYILIQDQTREKTLSALLQQQDKIEKLNRLTAGVVHELKNPLSSIKGYIQMLSQRLEDPDFVKLAMSVLPGEIDRMMSMVEEMLKYAKPSLLKREPVNLKFLVEDVSRFFRIETASRRIQLKTDIFDFVVLSNANALRQVLVNVLFNALEAMPAGGTVEIGISKAGDSVVLMVQDNGAGMSQEQLDHILDPYYTTKENGSGMGIPVSFQLMAELGGNLRFESTEGVGTTVFIEIPAEPDEL